MNQTATIQAPTRALRPADRLPRPEALHLGSLHMAVERALASDEGGPALASRLERCLPFLRAEYEECSTHGGLYTEVLASEPALAPRVRGLQARQASIVEALERLIPRLRRGSTARSDAEGQRLLTRLRALRREEVRLVLDADYRDLGGEG